MILQYFDQKPSPFQMLISFDNNYAVLYIEQTHTHTHTQIYVT
jgi:hypothetical protein